jgi:hypothetical protein
LLARLVGTWTIERSISPDGSFRGAASFVQRADGDLGYSEQGELVLPTGRFAAERRYRFEPHETGFSVHFVDTAPRLSTASNCVECRMAHGRAKLHTPAATIFTSRPTVSRRTARSPSSTASAGRIRTTL